MFFLHFHKCAGTSFKHTARKNGLDNVSIDSVSELHGKKYPKGSCNQGSDFYLDGDFQAKLAKTNLLTQEYGWFNPQLWTVLTKVTCLRHPIDRIYSDFRHTQDLRKLPAELTFAEWVREELEGVTNRYTEASRKFPGANRGELGTYICSNLYVEQLGTGSLQAALKNLAVFDLVIIQERYQEGLSKMRHFGWTDTDGEKHFTSWTPRRKEKGREVLAANPRLLQGMTRHCWEDILIYERACELAANQFPSPPPTV